MKKDTEIKENKTIVASTEAKEISLLDFLNIRDEEDKQKEEQFIKHEITAKINAFRISRDAEDKAHKASLKVATIDKENGSLIEESFTINGNIDEDFIESLVGQYVKVKNVYRHTFIERDFTGKEVRREYAYSADLVDLTVLDIKEGPVWDLYSFVEIRLDSVANVMRKGNPTGDVKLISIKENEDGSASTFECKLKGTVTKWNKEVFALALGKTIKIQYIVDRRINGKIFYSTEVVPLVVTK